MSVTSTNRGSISQLLDKNGGGYLAALTLHDGGAKKMIHTKQSRAISSVQGTLTLMTNRQKIWVTTRATMISMTKKTTSRMGLITVWKACLT